MKGQITTLGELRPGDAFAFASATGWRSPIYQMDAVGHDDWLLLDDHGDLVVIDAPPDLGREVTLFTNRKAKRQRSKRRRRVRKSDSGS